jgi:hypothetical protein
MAVRLSWLAVPLLSLIAGCTENAVYWARPGGTAAELGAAEYDCDRTASARYPPMTFGRPGYFQTESSFCSPTSGGPNCVVINPGYLPQATAANDTNEQPRDATFGNCMMSRGWRPSGSPEEAWYITRPPATAPSFRTTLRAARSWCESRYKPSAPKDVLDQCIVDRVREAG